MTTPDEPQAHGVRIDAQPGSATIALNGATIPADQLTGYVLEHSIAEGRLPLVVLYTRNSEGVLFEGLARVAVGVSKSPADLVTEFLAEVDPVLLDQTAMNRADYGGGPGATARAMLSTLSDWARGKTT